MLDAGEACMAELYDQIGTDYGKHRRRDPRIAVLIRRQLKGVSSLLNVGAGSGAYEPDDMPVVALEPSARMIGQRWDRSNTIQGRAEAMPFRDDSFDAALAVLTIHHWKDKKKGFGECIRVARKRVVIMTWDPDSNGFWLVQQYFPEILEADRTNFPNMEEIKQVLGAVTIESLPIPADCPDGFLGAYWRRPGAYLQETVRAGISSFSHIPGTDPRFKRLARDIATGAWRQKNRSLFSTDMLDIGYRLVTADLSNSL
jgi:SAM-dependent methyltransferase